MGLGGTGAGLYNKREMRTRGSRVSTLTQYCEYCDANFVVMSLQSLLAAGAHPSEYYY